MRLRNFSIPILEDLAWGRVPNLPRRRRWARWCFFGRTAAFFAIIAVTTAIFCAISYKMRYRIDRDLVPFMMGVTWITGLILCFTAPFTMENRYNNPRVMRANIHDFYLAGIDSRDMLAGPSSPQLAGFDLFAAVYPIAVIAVLFFARYHGVDDDDMAPILIFTVAEAEFALIAGTRYLLTMWTNVSAKYYRNMKLGILMFSSPIVVLILAVTTPLGSNVGLVIFLELISIWIRGSVVSNAWLAAQDRLALHPDDVLEHG